MLYLSLTRNINEREHGEGGEKIKQVAIVVMGYLGAVIGAGFASGQEIMQFFAGYGEIGLKGALLSIVLFSLCGGLLMHLAHRQQISNYQNLLTFMGGWPNSKIIDLGLAGFLFLGISTMLSASGAVFQEHLNLSKSLGIAVAYLAVMAALWVGKKGLVYAYNILVPIKIILLLFITGYAACYVPPVELEAAGSGVYTPLPLGWLPASLLYVAYNFTLAMVVLVEYQSISSPRNAIIGAVCGGLLLGILVILVFSALRRFVPGVLYCQVPMLYVAGMLSFETKLCYSVVLWMGIITTAIANAYGITQRVANFIGIDYKWCLLGCLTLALPIANQSFSSLVGHIYPAFGVLGLSIVSMVLYWSGKDIIMEIYYNIKNLSHREC